MLQDAIQYAKERKAFGKSIAEFGLIQEKLADCAVGIYTGESLVYRTSGVIDAALADLGGDGADSRAIQKRIEEYAVECSIVKVWVSEMITTGCRPRRSNPWRVRICGGISGRTGVP